MTSPLFIQHDIFIYFISGYYHTNFLAYSILEILPAGLLAQKPNPTVLLAIEKL